MGSHVAVGLFTGDSTSLTSNKVFIILIVYLSHLFLTLLLVCCLFCSLSGYCSTTTAREGSAREHTGSSQLARRSWGSTHGRCHQGLGPHGEKPCAPRRGSPSAGGKNGADAKCRHYQDLRRAATLRLHSRRYRHSEAIWPPCAIQTQ